MAAALLHRMLGDGVSNRLGEPNGNDLEFLGFSECILETAGVHPSG
jgi:hypothetical protein